MQEVELKFLNIDVASTIRNLESIGAERVYKSEVQDAYLERKLPDKPGSARLVTKSVRVRTVNGKTFIAHKGPRKRSKMKIREEIEIEVQSRDEALALLVALGFRMRFQSRKHRIHYELSAASFELDTYPDIPTYLEVETQSPEAMQAVCTKLGLHDGTGKSLLELYPRAKANERKK